MHTKEYRINEYFSHMKERSDRLMNYFLIGFFITGLLLALFYDTWLIAIGVGGLSLVAYYSAKFFLPGSNLYQYVMSVVVGVFMAQFIYQMHGMFEMHFFAFIGSAILITYQNWKLQIPLAVVVVVHHAAFGYLQFLGFDKIYFTQLEYMSLQTFVIHAALAATIFLLCGFWAYTFKKSSDSHIAQTFEIGESRLRKSLTDEKIKQQQEITGAVLAAHQEQRTFLGEELHDNINQILATAKLYLDCAISDEKLRLTRIKESKSFIINAMEEIRNLSKSLVAPKLNVVKVTDALTDLIENIKRVHSILFITKWNDFDESYVSEDLKLSIFRIVQEQVNNIIKHAKANAIIIRLTQDDEGIELSIKDDGIGFDPSQKSKGVGLQNISSRAEMFNGKILIKAEPGQGCELIVSFYKEALLQTA
jgi:signal transduction histidine kinase